MRRRLATLSLATTGLVVISFLIPLGLLVRRQAADRARLAAERSAQSTANLIALTVTLDSDPGAIEAALGPLDPGTIVVVSNGTTFGEPLPGQGSLVQSSLTEQASVSDLVPGGWEFALPVVGRDGAAVVDIFVPDDLLTSGVGEAWALLGLLGIVLVGVAVFVADRLGQRLVAPISALAAGARRLGEGDLDARVPVGEPEEIREVGESFNWLAGRLGELIAAEREAAADLSHRLRTPLTSLRLQAEKVSDDEERLALLGQVDRMEQAIDRLIVDTRQQPGEGGQSCELRSVVHDRFTFWKVLADEQGRYCAVELGDVPIEVHLPAEAVEAVLDVLIGNVFSHTSPGTPFAVRAGVRDDEAFVEVGDRGSGFQHDDPMVRGASGGGSTGLGLDIARKTAEAVGGRLELNDRPGGEGAVVRVWFGDAAG
ncbi:MAG: HAMP domain-containing sensor histidine kinase [Acidimicrobiia bacterium]